MNNRGVGANRQCLPVFSTRIALAAVALFLVPLLVFAGLAAEVSRQGSVAFDRPVMMWLHSGSTPWLTAAMTAITQLGGLVVPVVAVAIALFLCWLRRWRDAVLVVVAENGAAQLNDTLKRVFQRPRPDFWEHLSVENTHSFPSGHAMASMAIAAALLVLVWGTRYRWAALVAAVVYVVAVGASRVYLGVHFPSDVLAGWCLTALWVGVVVVVLGLSARWNPARLIQQSLRWGRGGSLAIEGQGRGQAR